MKIITSPAKLMNVENSTDLLKSSTPRFIEDAALIQSYLKEKSPKYLSELMEISPKLADENWERNQNGNPNLQQKNLLPQCLPLQERFTEDWMPKHWIRML